MKIIELLKKKNMSIYRLSKLSGIPYATLNDVCNEKARIEKCSAETIYRIAKVLDVTMEELLAPYMMERSSFENFKSAICHRVKELGDVDFIIDTLENCHIQIYHERKWYPECLYLLAMLDYISRMNDVPLCKDYDDLRRCKLEKPIYPAGIRAICVATGNDDAMRQAEKEAIPEFMRFNIVESEVRDVV